MRLDPIVTGQSIQPNRVPVKCDLLESMESGPFSYSQRRYVFRLDNNHHGAARQGSKRISESRTCRLSGEPSPPVPLRQPISEIDLFYISNPLRAYPAETNKGGRFLLDKGPWTKAMRFIAS
jgi:hypothetical protein